MLIEETEVHGPGISNRARLQGDFDFHFARGAAEGSLSLASRPPLLSSQPGGRSSSPEDDQSGQWEVTRWLPP